MSSYSKKNMVFILLIIITFTVLGYAKSLINVKVYVDNNFLELKTNKSTVSDLLKSTKIDLCENDIVRPSADTKLRDDMFIRIYRVAKEEIKEKKNIPYPTYHKYTSQLLVDKTIVKQYGKEGLKEVSVQRISIDGVRIKDYITKEKILIKPVSRILVKGTRRYIPSLLLNAKRKVKKVLTMVATAYSDSVISCGKWAGHPTPIGLKAQYGVIAVDPRVIPLRTKLYVDGYGYGIAGDVGGAIKGNRIDLCFNTYREAVNYGRKRVKVYILE
ncbi:MAG: 3D domain-containing protein [bacterium]